MEISLAQAQFLSLGLTTFLYGASLRKSLYLAFGQANMRTDRIVLHALPHHDCGDVFECVGGHPASAQQDPSSVDFDAPGGDPSANTTVPWLTHIFLIKLAIAL